jgi:hypothetical protein
MITNKEEHEAQLIDTPSSEQLALTILYRLFRYAAQKEQMIMHLEEKKQIKNYTFKCIHYN